MGHLALEMQRSAAIKKAESLRMKRGRAAADGDQAAFLVVDKEVEEAERRVHQLADAIEDAAAERKRREEAEAPRKRAEAHAALLESFKTAEKTRLDAVANAETSVRTAVDALLAVMAAGRRAREVADHVKIFMNDRSPMDSAASLSEANLAFRLSVMLAASLTPLAGKTQFFGHISLGCARQSSERGDWAATEQKQVEGLIAAFARAKP